MSSQRTPGDAQGIFPNTRWSVVLAARQRQSPETAAALEALCQTYWYPLYAFVRSSGHPPHDAQDLTQEFFARLLSREWLRGVDPEKGRFRTFLRVVLKRFLADEWDRVHAKKRGSGQVHLAFDTELAERWFLDERTDGNTPDNIYERRWALALLDEAGMRMEREYARAGKHDELKQLKPYLMAERGAIPYAEIAAAMRASEGAARVAVHRLRKRFREVFRETIADTVSSEAEVEQEIRHVLGILSQG